MNIAFKLINGLTRMSIGNLSLVAGLCFMGVAVIFGWPHNHLLFLPTMAILLVGGATTLLRLFRKKRQPYPKVSIQIVTLLAIVCMALVSTLLCSLPFIDYRMRLIVSLAGGQASLHSWAMNTLGLSRDTMLEVSTDSRWRIPKAHWPRQVRWLRPNNVEIQRSYESNREAIHLFFGGGFHHWQLIILPRDLSPPDDISHPLDRWFKWSDGMYGLQEFI